MHNPKGHVSHHFHKTNHLFPFLNPLPLFLLHYTPPHQEPEKQICKTRRNKKQTYINSPRRASTANMPRVAQRHTQRRRADRTRLCFRPRGCRFCSRRHVSPSLFSTDLLSLIQEGWARDANNDMAWAVVCLVLSSLGRFGQYVRTRDPTAP